MKKTNYSTIADRYDNNKYRHDIKIDFDLESYINDCNTNKLNILDLACGTGIYLYKQQEYFKGDNIQWYGLDACQEMLDKAELKMKNVKFTKALAEKLPYENQTFDFIINNYAFHHFESKEKVLNEVSRVTKNNGIFKMRNISMYDMPKWWIYSFFPTAYNEDLKRFWQKELIFSELSNRGFEVQLHIEYKMIETKLSSLIEHVKNRDISTLAILDDKEYMRGLELIEYSLKKDPEISIVSDFADMICIARKK